MTVVHEVLLGSAVQQQSIEDTMPCNELESVRSYRFNHTERDDTLCALIYWQILITELVRCGAEQ